jgi:hypothetical protein
MALLALVRMPDVALNYTAAKVRLPSELCAAIRKEAWCLLELHLANIALQCFLQLFGV